MARSKTGFAPDRMETGALRRAAVDTLNKLRYEFGLNLYEREGAIDALQEIVLELAARAARPNLFE